MGTVSQPNMPGTPEEYSCEWASENAGTWCETDEHPNLCNC